MFRKAGAVLDVLDQHDMSAQPSVRLFSFQLENLFAAVAAKFSLTHMLHESNLSLAFMQEFGSVQSDK